MLFQLHLVSAARMIHVGEIMRIFLSILNRDGRTHADNRLKNLDQTFNALLARPKTVKLSHNLVEFRACLLKCCVISALCHSLL
jgi:hypothetical protein